MVSKVADRVHETTTTTGTGPFTLSGAVLGKRRFAQAFALGTTQIMVAIEDAAGPNFVTGLATLDSNGKIAITDISTSNNNDNPVSFGPGIKNIYSTILADEFMALLNSSQGGANRPINTALPVISGLLLNGSTLSTTAGSWTNSPISYSYQWNRNGSPVLGQTGTTYSLGASDVGATISVTVVATNTAGPSDPTTSSETSTILAGSGASITGNAPPGTINVAYTYDYTTAGFVGALSPSLTSGAQPPGLGFTVIGTTIRLSGTPTAAGTSAFVVHATGATSGAANSASQSVTIAASAIDTRPGWMAGAIGTTTAAIVAGRTRLTGSANGGKAGNAVVNTTSGQYVFFVVLVSAGTPIFHDDTSGLNGGFTAFGSPYTDGNGSVWQAFKSDFPNAYPTSSYPSGASITLS